MHIRKTLFAAIAAFALPLTMQAQEDITIHDNLLNADETIGLPEGMLIDEDSLLSDWQARNYLFPDTTCENPNYNPTYAPEVYRERLQRLPTIVEMTYNEIVQSFIDRYCGKGRRQVSAMLGAANLYVPLFEQTLDEYGLPLELKFLPVIESALIPDAVSPAGAAGLWQLMLATGKQYNLQVDSRVDERRDPIKSTDAAARLLRDLFKIYGDWHLVLAAYNCGPGNVNKAIHRAGGERNYWKIYPFLPKETRGYVPAFIAATYVMNYYCDHNICPMRTKYPIQTDTVMVNSDVDLRQVGEVCGLDMAIVKALNPQYKTNVVPGSWSPCAIRLPQADVPKFITMEQNIRSGAAQTYVNDFAQQTIDPVSADNTRQGRPEVKPVQPRNNTPAPAAKAAPKTAPKPQPKTQPAAPVKKEVAKSDKAKTFENATRSKATKQTAAAKPAAKETRAKETASTKTTKRRHSKDVATTEKNVRGASAKAARGKAKAEPEPPAKSAKGKAANTKTGRDKAKAEAEPSAKSAKGKAATAKNRRAKEQAEPEAPAKTTKGRTAKTGKAKAVEAEAPAKSAGKGKASSKANKGKAAEPAANAKGTKGTAAKTGKAKAAEPAASTKSSKGKAASSTKAASKTSSKKSKK
ncbi:MAG: transglycosylase SLT domain-containing protein [Alloprevotella sp.]|nr:transglycosylase SLT domain-containing protein [Alloprevotella sp.]